MATAVVDSQVLVHVIYVWIILSLLVDLTTAESRFSFYLKRSSAQEIPSQCFRKVRGRIIDTTAAVEDVDEFNNKRIYPHLQSLLSLNYFRYYKVNMWRDCQFWDDGTKCLQRDCSVDTRPMEELPEPLRTELTVMVGDDPHQVIPQDQGHCFDESCKVGIPRIDTAMYGGASQRLLDWTPQDDDDGVFCDNGDHIEKELEYVDLRENPERFTGYSGLSTDRVWGNVYGNCLKKDPSAEFKRYKDMTLEERTFYRAISGLHASINIHLCVIYSMKDRAPAIPDATSDVCYWGPNLEEFRKRFDPIYTKEGPLRLKNLYFLYLVELRALNKARPYLIRHKYFTGNETQDIKAQSAVKTLLDLTNEFEHHFDETQLFRDDDEGEMMKQQFRRRYLNITRLMDCVDCDKCKVWGKLQTQGLGTALRILFAPDEQLQQPSTPDTAKSFYLRRNELVSLFNAFMRLSNSIYRLNTFKGMLH